MEVLPVQNRLRFQIATAAVSSIMRQENDFLHETAIDLSVKATSTPVISNTSLILDSSSSLAETSFSKAQSFHKKEISSPKEEDDSSSSSDDEVSSSQIKLLLPELHKHFDLRCKVGEGTFASVYLASLRKNKTQKFAIKHVTPTCHPSKIKREIQCLKEIGGVDNVCGILTCVRNKGNVAFILPFIRHDRFQDYFLKMDVTETRNYMRNLLIALRRVHKFNVIHRDVKPGNFLYDRQTKQCLLVDFGLAQLLLPRVAAPVSAKEPLPKPITIDSRKRKADDENAHSPLKKAMASSGRPVLISQTGSTKNVIVNKNLKPTIPGPVFQVLAPPQSKPMIKQPMTNNSKASFVRVKNSQVKMLNAPRVSVSQSASATEHPKPKCPCYKKSQLCEICLGRQRKLTAPRAGTPGFRPPEVLLKSVQQTTAVDIWAAGVMFISILSGSYPFFRSPDDMTALAELVTLFGSKTISETAMRLDRVFVCDRPCPPLDLQKLCTTLRANRTKVLINTPVQNQYLCSTCGPSLASSAGLVSCFCPTSNKFNNIDFPPAAYDLLRRLLDPCPATRISAEQALQHPFLTAK